MPRNNQRHQKKEASRWLLCHQIGRITLMSMITIPFGIQNQKAWTTTVAEYPELVAHGHSMQEAFYGAVDKVKTVIEEAYSQGTEPITPNRYLDFRAR